MITWIISQIPLWAWIMLGLLIAAPLFYFFGPAIIALWSVLPRWVKVVLGFIGALFSAYVLGMNRASRAAKERQKQLERQAVEKRSEIHEDVQKRSESDVDKSFDKWVR